MANAFLFFVVGASIWVSSARAELVFEDQQPQAAEERGSLRQALSASVKSEVTQNQNQAQSLSVPEVEHLSKTEMMRRERVREELKNEDLLQERLEELRLRDEKVRTKQIFSESSTSEKSAPVSGLPVQSEVVGAAVVSSDVVASAPTSPMVDRLQSSQASISLSEMPSSPASTRFTIQPRGGISSMYNTGYEVRPHFSGGIAIGASASEHVSVEAGYTYSEYGLALGSTNPFVQQLQIQSGWNGSWTQESFGLKQNLFDLGMKLHFLGRDSVVRPYLGGGGAYGISFVNYSQTYLNAMNSSGLQALAADSQINNFLGFLSAGLEVKISERIALGAMFRYYSILSSLGASQPAAFGSYAGYGNYAASANFEKQAVANTVSQNSFYSVLAGLSFTF